ncbi:hypothetical protein MBAV_005374 [Candidatus Magnetobacterium bavaricum]|uniref:Uncharacterized protein n=1 Tax=Candidatus Magnetobacterium bavaricum TaxID=29290 RepID=A0A0F3GKS6_9BACT|nr:hypothetical protein MBAV_005374 [Candidatus Magnetobacterium bavaricum]
MVLSILAGVIRYSRHTSADAASRTYPTLHFLRISNTMAAKVSAIFTMSYMPIPHLQIGSHCRKRLLS